MMRKIQVPFQRIFCTGERRISMILVRKEDRMEARLPTFFMSEHYDSGINKERLL